jgi:hypothetical protein
MPSDVLIWINEDGSARELTEADKAYVDTNFSPFDGARPYVKAQYAQLNGWGRLNGYLSRTDLPEGVPIAPAPPERPPEPPTPQSVAKSIFDLAREHNPGNAGKLRFE